METKHTINLDNFAERLIKYIQENPEAKSVKELKETIERYNLKQKQQQEE